MKYSSAPLATSIMDAMIDCVYNKLGVITEVTPEIVICIFSGDLYVEPDGYIYEDLDEMPFDYEGRHATGRAFYDGERFWNEYYPEEDG